MTDLNLVVKFELISDNQLHVEAASRMKVDGQGNIILYNAAGDVMDRIAVQKLRSFTIHPVTRPHIGRAA